MAFTGNLATQSYLYGWASIGTKEACKWLSMLPLGKIPYSGRAVSLLGDISKANGLILFSSTLFSETITTYIRAKSDKVNDYTKKEGSSLCALRMVISGLVASVVRIGVNAAQERKFSTSGVTATVIVAALSPLGKLVFDKAILKYAETVNSTFFKKKS